MERPKVGDRVVYVYDEQHEVRGTVGTVLDVTEGPDIDRFYSPIVRVHVLWDPSDPPLPDRVRLGRLRPVLL